MAIGWKRCTPYVCKGCKEDRSIVLLNSGDTFMGVMGKQLFIVSILEWWHFIQMITPVTFGIQER